MKKIVRFVTLCCVASAIQSPAQTFNSLASFDGTNGSTVFTSVVQGINGNFYGVTDIGGASDSGVVYEVTPTGSLTTLYSFCSENNCADGQAPWGLVQSADGNLYGTTFYGGANNVGTVFKITPAGQLTTLYSFCSQPDCTDGSYPRTTMIEAGRGTFYGVTEEGGNNNVGTIFKVTSTGELTTLYSFCAQSGCADGEYPLGALTLASNGSLFGTTSFGGTQYDGGTVFQLSPAGQFKILHSFCVASSCPDGQDPIAGLIQASNGNFYGTTHAGGAQNVGVVFAITPTGNFNLLHSFCGRIECLDGNAPYAPLVMVNGNLYGTTWAGGVNNQGTVFSINLNGALDTLYNFCGQANCVDGQSPYAGLLSATNGTFYGTTSAGGPLRAGTIFSLSDGLTPFVKTLPTAGKIGTKIVILGNNLTTATAVTFNGIAAVFKANSNTAISATVPAGATTGSVAVTTPTGTLSSNTVFRVIQ